MATGTPLPSGRLAHISPLWTRSLSTSGNPALTCSHVGHGIVLGPCWRSGTVLEFHGPPQDRAGAQGAQRAPRCGEKGEPAPVTSRPQGAHSGRRLKRRHRVFPFTRRTPGPEVATLVQGRFKRDGSASAEPEPHGGTGPNAGSPSPQHAQNPGPAPSGDGGERPGRPGAS